MHLDRFFFYNIAKQIISGLAFLQSKNIAHRDISETLKKVNSPNNYENETSLNGQNIKNEN